MDKKQEKFKVVTSYPQKIFIESEVGALIDFMNSPKRKLDRISNDYLIRENGEYKNYIGIDKSYRKGKNRHATFDLFWGNYETLNNEDDYQKVVDTVKKENSVTWVFKRDFDSEKIVADVIKLFDEKLSKIFKDN